ncbi:MAG: hypothetical protein EXS49_02600 [Candidatus Pacebacteria bacterium]|nr:hypothetical protein [Candidatus Paceibacterota bacterium]
MPESSSKKNILISIGAFLILGIGFLVNSRTSVPVTEKANAFWKIYTDATQGIKFKYPLLSNNFITPQEWPPKVTVFSDPFNCDEVLEKNPSNIEMTERVVNNSTYCVNTQNEGAAGSVFTTYNYKTALDNERALALSFILQYPRCENYDEPNKTDCTMENENLNVDNLADVILKSVVFK